MNLYHILSIRNLLLTAILLCFGTSFTQAQTSEERKALIQPFFDAKFGVFIHFGLYSVPEGEWGNNKNYGEWFQIETQMPYDEYSKFAKQFNPTKFNAREWVRNIKNAGIKYIVITTKHHDGFAMYNTKLTDYNVVKATPWAHDPMKDLAAACKEENIMLCFYYSIPDWYSQDFPAKYSQRWGKTHFHGKPNPNANLEKYVPYLKGQIREILTQYGPIGALWFDDGGSFDGYSRQQRAELIHAQEIVDEVHQLQPNCAIADRLGIDADYGTPEQSIPAGRPEHPFETCMPLNRHWGFNKNDHDWKSPQTVIKQLVTVVSKGGNYLLGIGTPADGSFPPAEAMPILDTVGQWLKVNGDSIYGTTAAPLKKWRWGYLTRKADKLYLHNFSWPSNGQMTLPLQNKAKNAYLLSDSKRTKLTTGYSEQGTVIQVPKEMPDKLDTVIVVEIENLANAVESTASNNLALNKPVEVSSEWTGRNELNKSHITDGKDGSIWASAEKDRSATVAVDLQGEHEVTEIMLSDAPYCRTLEFNVEAQINGQWQKIAEGSTIGEDLYLPLSSPIKAQLFRLNILRAKDTPTLAEFQIFGK